jgi:hypothetical protein
VVPGGFDAAPIMADEHFAEFVSEVQPALRDCSSGSCHGAQQSDFYITCGDSDEEIAFNFSQAWSFVNNPVDDSQLLRVPFAAVGAPVTPAASSLATATRDYDTADVGRRSALNFAGTIPRSSLRGNAVYIAAARCGFQACQPAGEQRLQDGAPDRSSGRRAREVHTVAPGVHGTEFLDGAPRGG